MQQQRKVSHAFTKPTPGEVLSHLRQELSQQGVLPASNEQGDEARREREGGHGLVLQQ